MRVLFLISGKKAPASRFRILNYLPYLKEEKVRCTVLAGFPTKYHYYPWLGFRPSQLLKRFVRCLHYLYAYVMRFDIVFIERELFDNDTYDLELRFISVASRSILDVDDAVFLRYPKKFRIIAENVDMIIAGNRNLIEKAKDYNLNTKLLPTSVIVNKYPVKNHLEDNDKVTIGWTGLDSNIPCLKLISDVLNRLAKEFDFKICIVSATPEKIKELALTGMEIQHIKWNPKTEYDDLSVFDIGVMPLTNDEWSRYKCGLKLIQYMALGIPVIASPVGVNADIVQQGSNGYCASSDEEWYDFFKLLLTSCELRKKIGLQARKDAEAHYGVETNSKILKQYLDSLVNTTTS